ncbi:DUF4179 domain-containing protein [Paenibacillus sp. MBLB4367]|uniref:DUF4179 domain-containing protein n=1 Tax=Paenibacillus sp. MBLB4367 TaxID=3384767 RepID=UPI0039080EEE
MNEENAIRRIFAETAERYEVSSGVKLRLLKRAAGEDAWLKRSNVRLKRFSYAAVSLTLLLLLASFDFINPAVSSALDRLGSLFETRGDKGLKEAFAGGYTVNLNETRTDQGIEVKVTDFYADALRVSFGFEVKLASAVEDGAVTLRTLRIDNFKYMTKAWDVSQAAAELVRVDDNLYAGTKEILGYPVKNVLTREDFASLPDLDNTRLVIRQIAGVAGNWSFDIPLDMRKVKASTRSIAVNDTKQSPEDKVTLEAVTFTPSGTDVRFSVRSEDIDIDHTAYLQKLYAGLTVMESTGRSLAPLLENDLPKGQSYWSINNGEVHAYFEPVKQVPKSLTVKLDSPLKAEFEVDLRGNER